jgi:hypothetical protein
MCASPLSLLRAGPPPPRVALLPDSLFFSRAVPIASGATPAEVITQVELAVEALSPFPLAQLYYGYFWTPGSARALVYASYRRRFTIEQTSAWTGAEWVLPAFAALLGASVEPATTVVLATPESLTAIHWDQGPVPSMVLTRPLLADATDEARAALRAELLRAVGGSRTIIDLPSPPIARPARTDREVVFASGDFHSRLPLAALTAIDVRDRSDLAAVRRARARDVILWRTLVGSVAACALIALGELALAGVGLWQRARLVQLNAQSPVVGRIMQEQELANRISELSTRRLLPLEMISLVASKKPAAIQFMRATTSGLVTLNVDAQTNNAGEIGTFRTALESLPECERVEIRLLGSRDNLTPFTLIVTFRPSALKPMAPPASA